MLIYLVRWKQLIFYLLKCYMFINLFLELSLKLNNYFTIKHHKSCIMYLAKKIGIVISL